MPEYISVFIEPVTGSTVAQVAIVAVLLLILLDIVFGCANAVIHHEFSSAKMREGIAHKAAELGFLVLGTILDACIVSGIDLGYPAPVLSTVCVYLIVMEVASLLETFAKMNPQLKDSPLFKLLAMCKEDSHVEP